MIKKNKFYFTNMEENKSINNILKNSKIDFKTDFMIA